VILLWYHIFGCGHHAGIVVIDNLTGHSDPFSSFSVGPRSYGVLNGKLVSCSGPWRQGTQDYRRWNGGGVVLLDDDSPVGPWVKRLNQIDADMAASPSAEYRATSGPFGNTGNSNSWASEFIERAGLEPSLDRAIGNRGGAAWVPGWGKDV
jgi:hypothetical protein